jgi:hypothetical protein
MITTILNSSRRYFLKRLGIASSVLAVSPTVLMGQHSKKTLRFALLGNDLILSETIERSNQIMITNDYKMADVIYVGDCDKINILKSLISISGKHLIIERNKQSDLIIKKCQETGILLAVVERSEGGVKLFDSVDYYESNLTQSFDFQKVMIKLDFLVRNTQTNKFKTFSL